MGSNIHIHEVPEKGKREWKKEILKSYFKIYPLRTS